MSSEEIDRLVKARDDAEEQERVSLGVIQGLKLAARAVSLALDKARIEHGEKLVRLIADAAALSNYDETHKEDGR